MGTLPAGYRQTLKGIKERIRSARLKAALASNRELIRLYWDIGRTIVARQRQHRWGESVVQRLASDLQSEFPGIQGFSKQNVWYMRAFYRAWADAGPILPQAVGEIPWGHNRVLVDGLGAGFAFVGQQVRVEVGGDDFYIDLLFYNLRLRCFVVIELKNGPFKPEYAGKMSFYLSAVDDRMRHPDDRPSIGLILCRSKNRLVAEYALRDMRRPIGVSAFRLTRALPAGLDETLPSVAELERELRR